MMEWYQWIRTCGPCRLFWLWQAWHSYFRVFCISLWMINVGGLVVHFVMQVGFICEHIIENIWTRLESLFYIYILWKYTPWNCHCFKISNYMSCFVGMNAIVLYIGHEVTRRMFPWSWQPYYHSHAEYLAMSLWGTTLWMIIAFALYKKNVFITLWSVW